MQEQSRHRNLADMALATIGAALVAITLIAVFFRYVINHSLAWSDEVVRYLFVWYTMLGAAVAMRECEHIRVEYFVEMLPPKLKKIVEIIIFLALALFQLALFVLALSWVWATNGSKTSALQWPLNLFFFAALPATLLLSIWYTASRLLRGEYAEKNRTEEDNSSCNS